jgi:hypothetical protein
VPSLVLPLLLIIAGCMPVPVSPTPIPPTETATITPVPTETIIWFPATATLTPMPTRQVTPTPELRPNISNVILEDFFSDKESWSTMRSAVGSVAYGRDELTLAVSSPRGLLTSLRRDVLLSDFYLEIEADPSLCRGSDAYGLMLRAHSNQDYYRLLINCEGQVRLERIKDAKSLPLQDWIPNGLPSGGMVRTRLGVWALNNELRIFINDMYQFTVTDSVWTGGQIGVFARSAGDTPLTVSFSKLSVRALEGGRLPLPTATPISIKPSATPRQTSTP